MFSERYAGHYCRRRAAILFDQILQDQRHSLGCAGYGARSQAIGQHPVRHETAQIDPQLHQKLEPGLLQTIIRTRVEFSDCIEHRLELANEFRRRGVKQ